MSPSERVPLLWRWSQGVRAHCFSSSIPPSLMNDTHRQVVLSFYLSASNPYFSHHANWRDERGVIRWGWTGSTSTQVMTVYAAVLHLSDMWGGRGLALKMRPFDCKCAFHLCHWMAWQRSDSSLLQTWRDLHHISDICVYPYFIVETSNLMPRGVGAEMWDSTDQCFSDHLKMSGDYFNEDQSLKQMMGLTFQTRK